MFCLKTLGLLNFYLKTFIILRGGRFYLFFIFLTHVTSPQIKDSPCLAGSPASNDEAKKTRKHHWFPQISTLTSICFIANKKSSFGNCRTTSLITKKRWLQYAKVTVTIISDYRSLFPRDIANLLVQFVLNGLVSN